MQPREREYTPSDFDPTEPAYGKGYVEFQARQAFEDLRRIYGFASARMIMAEIINDAASGKGRK